jgi:hypothetical protein
MKEPVDNNKVTQTTSLEAVISDIKLIHNSIDEWIIKEKLWDKSLRVQLEMVNTFQLKIDSNKAQLKSELRKVRKILRKFIKANKTHLVMDLGGISEIIKELEKSSTIDLADDKNHLSPYIIKGKSIDEAAFILDCKKGELLSILELKRIELKNGIFSVRTINKIKDEIIPILEIKYQNEIEKSKQKNRRNPFRPDSVKFGSGASISDKVFIDEIFNTRRKSKSIWTVKKK